MGLMGLKFENKKKVWTFSSAGASLFCGRARWAPPRFLFFRLLLFLYGYLAGASAEEGGVWTSLTCHTSPPPNPFGAHLSPLRVVCRLA